MNEEMKMNEWLRKQASQMGGEIISNGMTKRELFSALAMMGLCANESVVRSVDVTTEDPARAMGDLSVDLADTLIESLCDPENRRPS